MSGFSKNHYFFSINSSFRGSCKDTRVPQYPSPMVPMVTSHSTLENTKEENGCWGSVRGCHPPTRTHVHVNITTEITTIPSLQTSPHCHSHSLMPPSPDAGSQQYGLHLYNSILGTLHKCNLGVWPPEILLSLSIECLQEPSKLLCVNGLFLFID